MTTASIGHAVSASDRPRYSRVVGDQPPAEGSTRVTAPLLERDVVLDVDAHAKIGQGEGHARGELLVATQPARLDALPDRTLDLALRGDADLLQEFPSLQVEGTSKNW